MGDGNPLAKRMFHVHREAIAELFGVEIKCVICQLVNIMYLLLN